MTAPWQPERRWRAYEATCPGLVEILIGPDGRLPCDPPDACPTCRLFDVQQPGETRRGWLLRITGGLL